MPMSWLKNITNSPFSLSHPCFAGFRFQNNGQRPPDFFIIYCPFFFLKKESTISWKIFLFYKNLRKQTEKSTDPRAGKPHGGIIVAGNVPNIPHTEALDAVGSGPCPWLAGWRCIPRFPAHSWDRSAPGARETKPPEAGRPGTGGAQTHTAVSTWCSRPCRAVSMARAWRSSLGLPSSVPSRQTAVSAPSTTVPDGVPPPPPLCPAPRPAPLARREERDPAAIPAGGIDGKGQPQALQDFLPPRGGGGQDQRTVHGDSSFTGPCGTAAGRQ